MLDMVRAYFIRRRFRKFLPLYFGMVEYPDLFAASWRRNPTADSYQQLISGANVRLNVMAFESGKMSKSVRALGAPGKTRLRRILEQDLTDDYLGILMKEAGLVARMTYGFGWPRVGAGPVRREDVLSLFDEFSTAAGVERFIASWTARIQRDFNMLR